MAIGPPAIESRQPLDSVAAPVTIALLGRLFDASGRAMDAADRIRVARRHAKLSQEGLAKAVGVQRSAASQWESSGGKRPTVNNLARVAEITGVQFEWLATGRGTAFGGAGDRLDDVSAVAGHLVHEPQEVRVLLALRRLPVRLQVMVAEIAEAFHSRRA